MFFLFADTGRRGQGMYQFKNLMDIQKKYDYFCEEHGKQLNEVQEDIDLILQGKDRSGKHIDETLKKSKNLLTEQFKSVAGYLRQAERAQTERQYEKEDKEKLQNDLLPKGKTYCCVMKQVGLSRKEDIEKQGLKEKDLSLLFRLIPCVGYETGILVNDIGIPFSSVDDIAEYLGEKRGNDNATGQAIRRLKEAGIIFKYGDCFIMNDSCIRCGQMTKGVLKKRRQVFKNQLDKQGKKGGTKQGKKQTRKEQEKAIQETPQTQAGSEQETETKMPF